MNQRARTSRPQEVFLSHSGKNRRMASKIAEVFSWDSQAVDFTGRFDDGCRSLLRVWGLGFKKFSNF
jgi:hypothetical protein